MKSDSHIVLRLLTPTVVERGGVRHLIIPLLLAAGLAFAPWPALADMMSDDMQKLQDMSNFDRNLLVTNAMQLTDLEAKNFWPVYEAYLNDLQRLNRSYAEIIQSYVFALRTRTFSDDMAQQLTNNFLATQDKELTLRKSYAANLAKVLPGMTAARAVQLEDKIRSVAWYGLSSQLPLARQ